MPEFAAERPSSARFSTPSRKTARRTSRVQSGYRPATDRAKIELSARPFRGKLCASMQQVNLGMIGGGTVGSGVFHALQLNGGLLSSRIGVKVAVRKVAVKAFDEPRPYEIPRAAMTTDWQEVVNDPEVHVVAELVGGTTIATDDDSGRAQARQAGHHRQQGAALRARRGAVRRGEKIRRESLLRGQRLRRHSHHQIPARRVCRQPHHTRFTASSTAPAITSSPG